MEEAGLKFVAEGASQFFGDVDKADRAIGKFGDATDKAGQRASKFGDVARGAFERVGHVVVDFAGNALQALAGFGSDMLGMAGDYEQSMNVLQTQSGATDQQMQQIRQTAQALGADLTLPATSAVDAGNAMLELSKGGLEVDQAMAAAKGTLQLAAAAETDVATAANITTGALSAFGLEGEKAGYIADVLANSANLSRASITDMSQGFQQAAFRFKSAGQGADDLATSLVILTKNGLSGSDSGTALQNMLARLQGPTDKAAKLMHSLGINVYDASGNMKPMPDIIAIFNEKLGGMTQEQRNAALNTIFLSDGMKAMIPLLEAGQKGFLETRDAVNQQGSAAALAEAQMKGLKGAAAGLTSQIETLALEGLEPLLPLMAEGVRSAAEFAGSFVGKVGPAVKGVIGFLSGAAKVISDNLVPAIVTLGIVTIAYAATQIPILIPAVMSAVTAFGAQAVAAAAAVAPFALIGVAIFGVVKAYQGFIDKINTATTSLLESRKWWNDSTAAMERHGQASAEAKKALDPYATSINAIRNAIEEQTASLGRRMATGDVSTEQFHEEMAAINGLRENLTVMTAEYEKQEQAIVRTTAVTITATAQTGNMANSQAELQNQTALTVEELEALAQEFEKIMQKGSEALGTLATTHASFIGDWRDRQTTFEDEMAELMEERAKATTDEQKEQIDQRVADLKKGYDEQNAAAAKAYAEQAAAQRQALGEQLLAYIENQRQMGNISNEKAAEIREKTISHFGIMRDSAAALFGDMAMSVDEFASGAISDADSVARQWGQTEDAAVRLRDKANALKDRYVMELVAEMDKPGANIDAIRKKLAEIPARVESEIVIMETRRSRDLRGDDPSQTAAGRQHGGSVREGRPYIVGERRPEVFVPETNGMIMPSLAAYQRAFSPPASAAQMMNTTNYSNQNYARQFTYAPVYNTPPSSPVVDYHILRSLATYN